MSAPPDSSSGHGSRQFDIEPRDTSPFVGPDRRKHEGTKYGSIAKADLNNARALTKMISTLLPATGQTCSTASMSSRSRTTADPP